MHLGHVLEDILEEVLAASTQTRAFCSICRSCWVRHRLRDTGSMLAIAEMARPIAVPLSDIPRAREIVRGEMRLQRNRSENSEDCLCRIDVCTWMVVYSNKRSAQSNGEKHGVASLKMVGLL